VDGKSDGSEGRILEQKNKLDEIITKIKTDVRDKIEAVGGKIFDDLGAALLDGLFGDGSKLKDFRRQLKSTLRALGLDILKTILSSIEDDVLTKLKTGLKDILDTIFGSKKEPAANGNGAAGATDPIGILASVLPGGGILGGIAQAVAALPLPFPLPFAEGGRFASGQALLVGERGPELLLPTGPGAILPNAALGAIGAAGVSVTYNIDARGAAPGVERRIMRALKESEDRAVGRALGEVARSGQRGGAFARLPRV